MFEDLNELDTSNEYEALDEEANIFIEQKLYEDVERAVEYLPPEQWHEDNQANPQDMLSNDSDNDNFTR